MFESRLPNSTTWFCRKKFVKRATHCLCFYMILLFGFSMLFPNKVSLPESPSTLIPVAPWPAMKGLDGWIALIVSTECISTSLRQLLEKHISRYVEIRCNWWLSIWFLLPFQFLSTWTCLNCGRDFAQFSWTRKHVPSCARVRATQAAMSFGKSNEKHLAQLSTFCFRCHLQSQSWSSQKHKT